MRHKIVVYSVFLFCFSFMYAQIPKHKVSHYKPFNKEKKYSVDSLVALFSEFASSYIDKDFDSTYYSKKSVWIIDLVDTLNTNQNKGFYFSDKHVYVFSPARVRYAKFDYHNIAVLDKGRIRFFKAINCPQIGDSISTVTKYLEEKFICQFNKEVSKTIINRVKDCSKSGYYSIMRKMWPDDHDLIYDRFECNTK